MKYVSAITLAILVFLAVSSGVTKMLLMQQDVEFFSGFGFSNPSLIAFGFVQLVGGILLILKRTRFVGAGTVAITFAISLLLLLIVGNIPVSIATTIALLLLGLTMKQNWPSAKPKRPSDTPA